MRKLFVLAIPLMAVLLSGCSPHFNWREFTSKDASWQALFPDKPATASRAIDLGGMKTTMTMTAAEVDNILFAVGQAQSSDTAANQAALSAMQTALVRNIEGTVTSNKSSATPANITRDIDVLGTRNGKPTRMVAHFEAHGRSLYQVVVVGPAAAIMPEHTEQFLTSFKALK
ncbi:MAG: hypothetical protein M3Y65_24225 [Pseudomonadota bacterium]|nr:hypothetical protein [Pseudomonadota bacterium]